ncbi:hypothetical protein RclHR1_09030002 [Rhizophagus clarus]|uniref:Uncharacterized protein n=1 Tax=Rhizophagus clarus TaxID=94130 RepID=A0A2Z6SGN6_9GLOM|nr:hypothetical protein RclHR1_09030002 [Rhizophagus clarus]
MKKGFLLTKPASKIASTSFTTQVTSTSVLKSIPSDYFHDVIVDFLSGLIKRNFLTIFSSIITTDPSAIDEFLNTYKDQVVPMKKLSLSLLQDSCFLIIAQFLATLLNLFLLDDKNQEIFFMDSKICQALEYKRSAKKKVRKEKQKLQLQIPFGLDEQIMSIFSTESSEYTPSKPSGSRTVTFNQSLLSPPSTSYYKQQLKQNSKSKLTSINNGKKLKQKVTDNSLKNGNVIITGYYLQGKKQAQLLDLVVYDILAK